MRLRRHSRPLHGGPDRSPVSSFAIDPHTGYAVHFTERAWEHVEKRHGDDSLIRRGGLRAVLDAIQEPTDQERDRMDDGRRVYLTRLANDRWMMAIVEYDGIVAWGITVFEDDAPPGWYRSTR